MIDRLVKLTIHPAKESEFMDNFNRVKTMIRQSKGCLRLELLAVKATPGVLFTYSQWENEECLNMYLNSELFKSTWIQVKPMFASKAEAWTLEKLQDVPV